MRKILAIFWLNKVYNTVQADSAERCSYLVSAKTRWKKKQNRLQGGENEKCIVSNEGKGFRKNLTPNFQILKCRPEVAHLKMGRRLTGYWKNSVKKVSDFFSLRWLLIFSNKERMYILIWHFTFEWFLND